MNGADMQRAVHALSKAQGWWDGVEARDAKVIPEKLCLIHSEVSEALECYREHSKDGGPAGQGYALHDPVFRDEESGSLVSRQLTKYCKPVGLDSELADVVIRVMDLAEHLGIDLEMAISEKHSFNATRPRRHGGKAC